jgi:hypothetical protein
VQENLEDEMQREIRRLSSTIYTHTTTNFFLENSLRETCVEHWERMGIESNDSSRLARIFVMVQKAL